MLVCFGDAPCCAPPVEERCRRTSAAAAKGWVTAEYGMLPRTHTRGDREGRARQTEAAARRRSSA